ncbi:MAG: glycosyltransferase family 2 protein [Marinibacterium sp.]|nr:glycosyltransferase family 2 protein [Marinibacterium sp.]
MVDLSVVIPILNEEESVYLLYQKILESLMPLGRPFEIIFVDDGSTDRSFPYLRQIADTDPRVVVLKFRKNAGQTPAMTAGMEYARGRVLITMDGDLQNDPGDIPMMLAKLEEGYDLVIGWRMNRQDKWLSRKLPSMIANRIIGRVTGIPVKDNGCSLKVYRASMMKRVPLYSDMHRFIPAMTLPYGARIAEVPVRHHARQYGASKYGLSRVFKVILDLIAIKTVLRFARQPMRRFFVFGGLLLLITLIWASQVPWRAAAEGGGNLVIPATMVMLIGSLSVFLFMCGAVCALIFQRKRKDELNWLGHPPG